MIGLMILPELDPIFYRYDDTGERPVWIPAGTLAEAQGVSFLCPKCFVTNAGPIGTHRVLCWFRDRAVPADAIPGPARWAVAGTSFQDLTLQPSILILGSCAWHGWITRGAVTSC